MIKKKRNNKKMNKAFVIAEKFYTEFYFQITNINMWFYRIVFDEFFFLFCIKEKL